MGNRAVITFTPEGAPGVGIYLHWNGGRESVRAFLDTCRARGYRSPVSDPAYAMAGLVGVIREFFGPTGLSVGVDLVDRLDCDNWDNGVYQVGADWSIVARWGKGSQNLGADALGATMAPLKGEELTKYRAIMESLQELATRGPAGVAA